MPRQSSESMMNATELVKKVQEMKARQAAASEAVSRARRSIRERGQFVPVYPQKPVSRITF